MFYYPSVDSAGRQNQLEQAALYELLFQRAGVGLAIADLQGRFIHVNPELAKMLDYQPSELIGKHFSDITHPEDILATEQGIKELIAGRIWRFQTRKRYVCAQGETAWMHLTLTLAQDTDGSEPIFVGLIEDISETVQAEEMILRALERVNLLHEIDQSILAADSPDRIAQQAVNQLHKLLGFDYASVIRIEAENLRAEVIALHSENPPPLPVTFSLAESGWDLAALHAGEIIFESLPKAVNPLVPFEARLRQVANLPLQARGQFIGVLRLGAEHMGGLNREDLDIAMQAADSLAIALDQAQLLSQVSEANLAMRLLNQRLVSAQENERRRLSHEIHDEAGQILTALNINLAMASEEIAALAAANGAINWAAAQRRVQEAAYLANQVLTRLQTVALDLRPPMLDTLGLTAALEEMCRDFARQTPVEIAYNFTELNLRNETLAITLYRIMQEALTNVARHAHAKKVRASVKRVNQRALLEVVDDGVGLESKPQTAGLGLAGMRERIDLLGGQLVLHSQPGQGTTLQAYLPLGAAA